MTKAFHAYPNKWGTRKPDPNIDHRRVPNLMTYFSRKGKAVPITAAVSDYLPGDVVAWDLGNGTLHMGLITDEPIQGGTGYLAVHNIGAGALLEDVLLRWRVIGHYRYFETAAAATGQSAHRAAARSRQGSDN